MKKKILLGLLSFSPVFAFAQAVTSSCGTPGDFDYIICKISGWIGASIPILISLAVAWFIWGVISYVIAKEEETKKEGKDKMIYGIIGLLVIVSIWGLVSIVQRTFGVTAGGTGNTVYIPCIPGTPGNPNC